MIGFYDYTVILTYAGLLFSLFGMFQAIQGHPVAAILCMSAALVCDTMDGRVARAKKNRTDRERQFGIQIDSLCDTVSFGIFPGVLCYTLGLKDLLSLVIIAYFCLCCIIRLGYFNVLAVQPEQEGNIYHGLPCVGMAVLMPAAYMVGLWLPESVWFWVLRGLLALIGTLFILDFKVPKPQMRHIAVLSLVVLIPLAVILLQG